MFREIASGLKQRLRYYRRVAAHPETPRLAKWLLVAAIAYALSPIDLIPDWIPVLGHLDDVLIVPGLVAVALLLVPEEVKRECREAVNDREDPARESGT